MSGRPQQNDVFEAVPKEIWMFEASGHRSSQTDSTKMVGSAIKLLPERSFFEGAQVL